MKTLYKFILILLFCAPSFASADFTEDKATCYAYSDNLGLFAQLRDENMPRESLIDRTLNVADEKSWSSDETLLLIHMIRFVYANPDIKPDAMRKGAYDACMKQKGHVPV
jgi:hypothetical protein